MQKLLKKNIKEKINKSFDHKQNLSKDTKVETSDKLKNKKVAHNKRKSSLVSKVKYNKSSHFWRCRYFRSVAFRSIALKRYKKYSNKNKVKPYCLNFRIAPNNVFCSATNVETNTTLHKVSGGSYKYQISKKGIRHYSLLVLKNFFEDLRRKKVPLHNKPLAVKITTPNNLKKSVLDTFKNLCLKRLPKKKSVFLEVTPNKAFNGCRPRKQVRKANHGLRLFK